MYKLCLYDTPLAYFDIERTSNFLGKRSEIGVYNLRFDEKKKNLLPPGMPATEEGLVKFLSNRIIPKNRQFVAEILSSIGLSVYDVKGVLDLCKGLSLNDSFWVIDMNFGGKFDDYNLFENPFSEALSLVAYTGTPSSCVFTTSPELTTDGTLAKAWRNLNDGTYLYKSGSKGFANSGREPFCEFYAAQVAEAMQIDHVYYGVENWKGITASYCKLFTNKDTSYFPAYDLVGSSDLCDYISYFKNLGRDIFDKFKDMLIFDAVVMNTDRHFNNFGVLFDNKTMRSKTLAPVFDNGLSLLTFAYGKDYESPENLTEYSKTRVPPYAFSYDEIVKNFMGTRQRGKLRKLIGFKFKQHPLDTHPEYLPLLERVLQDRISGFLRQPQPTLGQSKNKKHSNQKSTIPGKHM